MTNSIEETMSVPAIKEAGTEVEVNDDELIAAAKEQVAQEQNALSDDINPDIEKTIQGLPTNDEIEAKEWPEKSKQIDADLDARWKKITDNLPKKAEYGIDYLKDEVFTAIKSINVYSDNFEDKINKITTFVGAINLPAYLNNTEDSKVKEFIDESNRLIDAKISEAEIVIDAKKSNSGASAYSTIQPQMLVEKLNDLKKLVENR